MAFSMHVFCQIDEVVSSQELKNLSVETNNIRVDPEWLRVYESNSYPNPKALKTDNAGNIYSAGILNYHLKAGNQRLMPAFPTICKNGECREVYYLMKHDSKGKLLWTRFLIGNGGLVNIFIDNKGLVALVGSFYGKALRLSSTDTTTFKLNKTKDQNLGIFVARYDAVGKIKEVKLNQEIPGFDPKSYFLDGQENLIIGGNNYFSVKVPGSSSQESRNAITVIKLNSKLELKWQTSADRTGNSQTESVVSNQQGEIYLTGKFYNSMAFKIYKFKVIDSTLLSANLFLAKFNAQGSLIWAAENIGKYRYGSLKKVVCDSKGNPYVFGVTSESSSSNSYLARLDNTGNPVWLQEIKGESISFGDMAIDENDKIYLGGSGLGAAFGSSGPNVYSFKEKKREGTRGYDFFLAKYSNQGLLEWLKAAGGQSSIYLKAISPFKNDVITFGQSGGNLRFWDTVRVSQNGANYWLAKFGQEKLAQIDNSPQKKSNLEANAKPPINTDPKSCTCSKTDEKITSFTPSVEMILPYNTFAAVTGWEEISKQTFYDYLFYTYYNTSYSTHNSAGTVTLAPYRPIRLVTPNKNFGVNFTPCTTGQKLREKISISFSYSHGIKGLLPNYDYKTFDKSARSYFDVMMAISNKSDNEVLDKALFNHTVTDLSKFFSTVNKKYKTNIKIKNESQEEILDKVIDELTKKKISIEDFLFQEFVATSNTKTGKITETETQRLFSLFPSRRSNLTLEQIDRYYIYPDFKAMLSNKNLGIEISDKIIRQWDGLTNKPAVDKQGNSIPSNILLDVKNVICSSDEGLEAEVTGTCFTRSEITGTGTTFNFTTSQIIGTPDNYQRKLDLRNYPLFITDSIKTNPEFSTHFTYRYDTLLTKFTGLSIPEAQFYIPFKTRTLSVKGKDLLLNNFLIAGLFDIPLLADQNSEPNKIKILVGDTEETTTLQTLTAELKTVGLKHIKVVKNGGKLNVYFKKTAFAN